MSPHHFPVDLIESGHAVQKIIESGNLGEGVKGGIDDFTGRISGAFGGDAQKNQKPFRDEAYQMFGGKCQN